MFAKADPTANMRRQRAKIRFRNGESEIGALLTPQHKAARDVVNDDAPFIEFETEAGGVAFLLKAEIARIDPIEGSPASGETGRARGWTGSGAGRRDPVDRFAAADPHTVLGLPRDADDAAIRRAWVDLARAWHPDRMASLGLPPELVRHATGVLARINAAYESLNGAR